MSKKLNLPTVLITNEYLSGNSLQETADKYQVNRGTIKNQLKLSNIQPRSHRKDFFNESYFSNGVISHNHAYILGLLYADGYNNRTSHIVKIDLKSNDIALLNEIKVEINSTQEIKLYTNKTSYGNCEIARLRFTSEQFSNDLELLGCIQNKSLLLKYPTTLIDEFFFSFLRGYYDGDGSLTLTKTKYFDPQWSIVGTPEFLTVIQKKLTGLLNINSQISQSPKKSECTKYLKIKGTKQLDKLLNNLYLCSGIKLTRKYLKYQDYLTECSLLRWRR
jgi:hypothetical protein